jgi:hypothetical protein
MLRPRGESRVRRALERRCNGRERGAVTGQSRGFRRDLLQELLWTYGPCGQEDAVRDVCRRELEPFVDERWQDEAGNLVGLIRGSSNDDGSTDGSRDHDEGARATRVMAHMDELSMIVKRVEPDGTLHVTPLGKMYPGNFGLGPGDDAIRVYRSVGFDGTETRVQLLRAGHDDAADPAAPQ